MMRSEIKEKCTDTRRPQFSLGGQARHLGDLIRNWKQLERGEVHRREAEQGRRFKTGKILE